MGEQRVVGEIELVGRMAIGGMAEVWLGREHDRWVAVKRVLPEVVEQQQGVSWFLRELSLHEGLDHPNVVEALGAIEVDEVPALALELVEGETLRALLSALKRRRARLDPILACQIAQHVARGLHYIHSCVQPGRASGVIHCDLSPANVLLSWRGEVKLADFGIARRLGELPPGERLQGKPGYLSPEQALGLALDARSDVFGLGILLYELLTGERLVPGTDLETSARQVCALGQAQLTRPIHVPAGIWAVLCRMLARDPKDRPSSGEQVADALERAVSLGGLQRPFRSCEGLAMLFATIFPRWVSPIARFASVEQVEQIDVLEEQPVIAGRLVSLPPRRLGQLLICQGTLTGEELEWALHLAHAGKPLGQHLMDLGLIEADDLERALLSQRFLPRAFETLEAS